MANKAKDETKEVKMVTLKVLGNLKHGTTAEDNREYVKGEKITVDEETAKELIARGCAKKLSTAADDDEEEVEAPKVKAAAPVEKEEEKPNKTAEEENSEAQERAIAAGKGRK